MTGGRDRPWLMRTYSGHSSARVSNALFRENLSRGQTGLSVAFDLPTQTGYDSDHPMARGEVGKVGVPVCHLGDMETLFDGIPLDRMNSSMTINATAPWLLALYVALADRQEVPRAALTGTVQNDIVKEYLARGTYIFPPRPSLTLTGDVIAFAWREMPKWNPTNVCSYHLREAGATPVQEVAFALATAVAVLDEVRARDIAESDFPTVVGRMSFFVNAGLRFVTEMCKMRAFAELWDEITRDRYGVADPKLRRFRYGVQVNSLGLTEQQPENNVYRILLEMLAVTLSKNARARAIQLPAWNEALGLPRPWDQQWSLRAQQILAFETDLLEFGDIFDGSHEIAAKVAEMKTAIGEELARIEAMGGALAAVESGYMKSALVRSNADRLAAIESGDRTVIGVNRFTESAPSPLAEDEAPVQAVDRAAVADQIARLAAWREARDAGAVKIALVALREAANAGGNVMDPSIACARAGVTTGEWSDCLREAFGEYRAATGLGGAPRATDHGPEARAAVARLAKRLGRPPRILIGKPGLDGHSNGAEQVALRARDSGMEVIYDGIRHVPAEIIAAALQEDVDLVGLSVLSGSPVEFAAEVLAGLRDGGGAEIPVVVGGIVPPADRTALLAAGVARVYTPKDYALGAIIADMARVMDGEERD